MMTVKIISPSDDLIQIVDEINNASWDESNEISKYDAESLLSYLKRQDTLFVTCHLIQSGKSIFLGMASARLEIKPYDKQLWLYVDEVDVCADQRQKGAGKALMKKLIEIASLKGCEEVWLGAEVENIPANALYRSMEPDDVAQFVGYTYEIDE